MKFDQLYSGSKGNLYVVSAGNGKRLIIDPGVTWKKLQKALNYDLTGIVGCLLTHEHKDHSKAVKDILQAGIYVFASQGTLDAIDLKLANHRRAKVIRDKSVVRIGLNADFKFRAFSVSHDATEPLGFVIKADDEYLLFATDTSHIRQQFMTLFNIIAIECSYDKAILNKRVESGDINEEVAKRLLTSHTEKQEAMRYIRKFCDISKCREIHLLHCSRDNLNIEQTKTEFANKFFIEVKVVE
jgi:phosphoribosyl 1,2-cyclic phosphodiesterase